VAYCKRWLFIGWQWNSWDY